MPKSHNPLNAYMPDTVPKPMLTNSARLDQLVRDGKLYLSLKDAIELALEDNLDLAIARYNLPIAKTCQFMGQPVSGGNETFGQEIDVEPEGRGDIVLGFLGAG